ncbi:MAG: GNAT family N-acetyltransferase [Streptosporangiaceae bacterium]
MDRSAGTAAHIREPNCVGALIRNRDNRVYIQRRSLRRRQLPGAWDIVGGHVNRGEKPEAALAREVMEETGWQLRRIEAPIADWEWTHNGVVRRELDYLVEVNGDLGKPRLESGKHDKFDWVGFDNINRVRTEYDRGNDVLWTVIRRAARIRLTSKLRMEPISASSVEDLRRLYSCGIRALDGRASHDRDLTAMAAEFDGLWDKGGGYGWLVFDRSVTAGPAIGYGGLRHRNLSGNQEWVLDCAVPSDGGQLHALQEIIQALLAFARIELQARRVIARAEHLDPWAKEVMRRSGMFNSGPHFYEIGLLGNSRYAVDQREVTGIGQILAVPS